MKEEYRAIIVGIRLDDDISYSMDELEGLAEADGIEVLGRVIQALEKPNTATLIGKGKVQELAEMCSAMEADTIVFNEELSGVQMRNLEEATGARIIDRTVLILDIFADRATSVEGKLQVELAQLQYRLPRLTGFGKALSRLGGGIGTRGPGEKKLETDRRHIARRIDDIKAELRKAGLNRQIQRAGRDKSRLPVAALVGYTNSGKSAIMNSLLSMTERDDKLVKSEDMLFATLDTKHRKIAVEQGCEFILIDTVGFVSKLPHGLVEAFKSTLEEVKDADLLIHTVDSSYENRDFQIEVTNKVIDELGAGGKRKIMAYNKMDLADERPLDVSGHEAVYISARTGENMDHLLSAIKEALFGDRKRARLRIPYDKGAVTSYLCENGEITAIEYQPEGTMLEGSFDPGDYQKYRKFEINGEE
ncbi:MAG TPA: GTPase HflX [Candidatus Copromorpha excrementipullorum]|uniref:GTPase HflX n=1 Tax=Candidatus Allocopromorpha excrementipullorum TaxID=2840743 RepID=A0A9D1SVF0_9FIRM|nr:GTPase HflX [Candidatus Copromorpha excrementipullorum]